MLRHRINTITMDFKKVKKKPSHMHLHMWVRNNLKLSEDQIIGIQYNHLKSVVYLKLTSNIMVKKLLNQHGEIMKYTSEEGTEFEIFLSEESEEKIVRVFDFPFELDNNKIKNKLENYGIVKSIRNEYYKGDGLFKVDTGIRTAIMLIRKNIPSYLSIEGASSLVTYKDQIRTCMICDEPGHERKECPKLINNRIKEIRRPNVPVATSPDLMEHISYAEKTKKDSNVLKEHKKIMKINESQHSLYPEILVNIPETEIITQDATLESEEVIEATPMQSTINLKKQKLDPNGKSKSKRKRSKPTTTSSEEEKKLPKLKINTNQWSSKVVHSDSASDADSVEQDSMDMDDDLENEVFKVKQKL